MTDECAVEGCTESAEWGEFCYEHFQEWSDRLWWEQVRAATFATATIKNEKAREERVTK